MLLLQQLQCVCAEMANKHTACLLHHSRISVESLLLFLSICVHLCVSRLDLIKDLLQTLINTNDNVNLSLPCGWKVANMLWVSDFVTNHSQPARLHVCARFDFCRVCVCVCPPFNPAGLTLL